MTSLCVFPIVEGHGDKASVRLLLNRVWYEVIGADRGLMILPPYRLSRLHLGSDRERSPSFDKLCRELEKRLSGDLVDGERT